MDTTRLHGDSFVTDENRVILQLTVNILGAGFVTVLAFAQFGEYFADHHLRHIFAALAWFVLMPVFVLRTAGFMTPPLIDPQLVMDWASIGWAVSLVFGVIWGVLRIVEKRNDDAARKRLGLDKNDEGEGD
jgi:hypothetical protein